jgi:high-affinity K+ transport system ATPase subunit B
VVTTVEFAGRPSLFVGLVTLWLWATVLFANLAEVPAAQLRAGDLCVVTAT